MNVPKDIIAASEDAKNSAYAERDRLVAALSKIFPSWLGYHGPDALWEDAWRTIVYIELPTGQISFHVHEGELPWFSHLSPGGAGCIWDGHTTPEKFARLDALMPTNFHTPAKKT